MDLFTMLFWGVAIMLGGIALTKNRQQSLESMKKTRSMMANMMGDIIAIIFMIGLILTFVPPSAIEGLMGSENIVMATVLAALAGSVTLIPAFVAFPLVGSFVDLGASILPAVAFLTTLTMVGVVTFPLEKKEFGAKFALSRNALSFLGALVIAVLMGVFL